MGNIYFTSDLHFGHDKSFLYEPRGFESIWKHDEQIIKNWNEIINIDDDIYILGDLMLGDNSHGIQCIKQLKGNIHVIRGNHDTDSRMKLYNNCYNIVEITEGQFFKWRHYHFYLSHYPCICSNYDVDKPLKARMINLCGHRHTNDYAIDMDKGLCYHVELDAHYNYPIKIENIIEDIKTCI